MRDTQLSAIRCLLRTSGDVSPIPIAPCPCGLFAPHERRCFYTLRLTSRHSQVCSARAEMFLNSLAISDFLSSLLRTSGDVSIYFSPSGSLHKFAPHERRCFFTRLTWANAKLVCSARAEMFLKIGAKALAGMGLLRTSGDVSTRKLLHHADNRFAPHERRCFR